MAASPKLHAPEPDIARDDWTIRDLIRAAAAEQDARAVESGDAQAAPDYPEPNEWTETWALVAGAVDAVRGTEALIAELEARNREVLATHAEDIRAYEARIDRLNQIVARTEAARFAAEERASSAQARAATAEEFLRRIGNQVRGCAAVRSPTG